MNDRYARTELPGGLVVLTESMPGIRSASLGVWVRAGSVHESPAQMGISHMLEHMVFKGTSRYTARDLALVLERLGGSLDAYTTREHTSYQARVLDTDIDIAMDVLSELCLHPLLRAEDLELEREVVLEEIATVDDTPDDLVFDLHATQVWGDHPYGFSILGTTDTVAALTAGDLRRMHDERYHRGNLVIAGAGNVDHEQFVERVAALWETARVGDGAGTTLAASPVHAGGAGGVLSTDMAAAHFAPAGQPGRRDCVSRSTAQTHLVWGTPTFGHGDPRRIALVMLSNAFGGGMSSRLFQRIREELGLAYAVYAYQTFYADAGMSGVYVGTRPDSADRAEAAVNEELERLSKHGLTQDELDDVKGQVKGQIVLSLESSSARLHRVAGTELYGEPYRTLDDITALVDAVTLEDVAALAAEYFTPGLQSVLRLGPTH